MARIEVTLGDNNPKTEEVSQKDTSHDMSGDQSVETESEWISDDEVTDNRNMDVTEFWEEDLDFYKAPNTPFNIPIILLIPR